ncbi:MAG: hypothetical protein P8X57_15295 [Cyclobacteriaceae bacterium]
MPNHFLIILFSLATLLPQKKGKKITFGTGEVITYRVHYGFINAAEARMETV